ARPAEGLGGRLDLVVIVLGVPELSGGFGSEVNRLTGFHIVGVENAVIVIEELSSVGGLTHDMLGLLEGRLTPAGGGIDHVDVFVAAAIEIAFALVGADID